MRRKRIDHGYTSQGAAVCSNFLCVFAPRNWEKRKSQMLLLFLVSLFFSGNIQAADTCLVDTSQAQFQQGIPTGVAVLPAGDVTLAASGSVDQQNTALSATGFTFHSYHWFGQTFTAGTSGPLSAVDLRLFCDSCTGTTPDITVSIRATAGGLPVGDDLSIATIPGFSSATGQYFKATFATPLNVSAGTMYAIIVRANALPSAGSYAYLTSTTDAYSGGTRLTSTTSGVVWGLRDFDAGFRTYIGSGYVNSGDLVSSLKDSNPPGGSNPTWSTLSWDGTTPANTTLRFQAAGSNSSSGPFAFVGPDGTAGTFFNSTGANLNQFNGLRYLKYKALLSNTNPAVTPVLKDATVCYDHVMVSSADLKITKTNNVSTSTPGSPTTYTIVASNAGPSNVSSATVSDTFHANLQNCSWTCSGAGGGSCTASGNGNINQIVNLPAGASTTFVAQCHISPSATGSLVNTATISSTIADPLPGNNSATDTDTLTASANLGITKTNNVSTSTPGAQTTYTIVASNAGPSNVSSATVSDTFHANLQNCSWTCSGSGGGSCVASGNGHISQNVNLPAGASTTFMASCGIQPSATGSLVNTATISSAVADPVPGNNSATDTDTLAASANLSITKTNGTSTSTPGGSTTYTMVAGNAGPSNVTGATVTDTFPAALQSCTWTCSGANGGSCPASGSGNINHSVNLPVSGTATFTANCNVKADATGSLVNTASISSAVSDPVPANNSATDTDTLAASANLGITKTNNVSTSTPGAQTTYTIVASNAGPSNVSSATVSDTFHANLQNCSWTCSSAGGASCGAASGTGNISQNVNLPVNGSVSYSASCTVAASATGTLVNTASISSAISDPVPANNSATDTDTLAASANLGITKTNNVSTSTPGAQTTYTIVASNAGPSNVSSATVSDTFHANLQNCSWTCSSAGGASCGAASGTGNINRSVNLPVGGSVTYSATCTVSSSATGSLVNTATISSAIADPVPANNSATDTDTLPGTADLSISVSNEDSIVIAGSSVLYTIVAANAGPAPVTNAIVTDVFSAKLDNCEWLCNAGTGASCASAGAGNINQSVNLQPGANLTFTAICDVDDSASGSLVNTATISSAVSDPVPANNSSTHTDTLSHMADLAISLDGVTSTKPGSPVSYTIVASNAGASAVNQVTVKNTLPAALNSCTWTCQGSAGGSCPASGSGHIDHVVTLPRGSHVSYSATCQVSSQATGSIVNVAEVTSGVHDPDPQNNHAMDVISLQDEVIFKSGFD